MKHDDASPPCSMRGAPPDIKATIRSDAMKRFLESAQRRIFLQGESTPMIVQPGDGLELYRLIKDHLLETTQKLHIIDPSKLSHEEAAPDTLDDNLLIMNGDALPLNTWKPIEDSLEERLAHPRGIRFPLTMVLIVFADQRQLVTFKFTQLMTSKTNWDRPLVWPHMEDRSHDRRGLMREILDALRHTVSGIDRINNKNISLDAQASAIIQGEQFATVFELYQRLATGFRHAINGSESAITKKHLFLPAEKTQSTVPQA